MEHKFINPIDEIKVSNENKNCIEMLKKDFYKLSEEEQMDVVELQNSMLKNLANPYDRQILPKSTGKVERTSNEIISHMSRRALDYSQKCINYYHSQIENTPKLFSK